MLMVSSAVITGGTVVKGLCCRYLSIYELHRVLGHACRTLNSKQVAVALVTNLRCPCAIDIEQGRLHI